MSRHLGDLGVAHEPEEITFTYFGAEIRVNPYVTDIALMELLSVLSDAEQIEKTDDGLAQARMLVDVVAGICDTLIAVEDVENFRRLSRKNGQGLSDLLALMKAVLTAVTARPTVQPSASSDGLSNTAPSSTEDSSSRALRALEGRPDLQIAVLRAEAG